MYEDTHIEIFAGCLDQPFKELIDVYINMCNDLTGLGINFSFNVSKEITGNETMKHQYDKFVQTLDKGERATTDINVACALMQAHGKVKH
jgi:hypothetical protein